MNYFKRSNILWGLFVAVGAILLGIVLWTPSVGGTLLDSLSAVSEVQALLEKMTKAQKDSHFLMTLLLDMPYPFIAVCKLVKYTFPSQFFEQAMPGVLNKPEHRYKSNSSSRASFSWVSNPNFSYPGSPYNGATPQFWRLKY